jgi:hypothetical protein
MRTENDDADPWETADPSLAVALAQLQWYRRAADRARIANWVSEVLLLVMSAATTVAAALAAVPWLTAVLAAGSLVLTGLRKSFDWHENWVSRIATWSELRSVVNQYRLLPDDRRDEHARRQLLTTVDEMVTSETGRWASRRRTLQEAKKQDAS